MYHEADGVTERFLSLLVAEGCNLRCSYCFEHVKRPQRMPFEVARSAVEEVLVADDGTRSVVIDFMGGEPMLAFPVIRQVVEYVEGRDWPKSYHFCMSTNGTLFTKANTRWFVDRRSIFTPMLSFDGTRSAHDMNRDGSYDRVSKNLDFFRNWPHQPFRMTVEPRSLPYLADGIFSILALGFPVEAHLVFEDVWGKDETRDAHLRLFEHELLRLVDFFTEFPHVRPPGLVALPLDKCLQQPRRDDILPWCGAGREMVTVGMDGKRYPCHRFLEFCSGRSLSLEQYHQMPPDAPDEPCSRCPVAAACPTCQAFNWETTGSLWRRPTTRCEFTRLQVIATAAILINRARQLKASSPPEGLTEDSLRKLRVKLESGLLVLAHLRGLPKGGLSHYVEQDWAYSTSSGRVRWQDGPLLT